MITAAPPNFPSDLAAPEVLHFAPSLSKAIPMKQVPAPTCPRCNSSGDVKKITYGLAPSEPPPEISNDGFVLDGRCIRPDSPEWYCSVCDESFGAWREFWGDPLTDLIQ